MTAMINRMTRCINVINKAAYALMGNKRHIMISNIHEMIIGGYDLM
jgi:hypothetical protein